MCVWFLFVCFALPLLHATSNFRIYIYFSNSILQKNAAFQFLPEGYH